MPIKKIHNSDPSKAINWFDDFAGPNKYAFLSNFYVGEPIRFLNLEWKTGEHLFAAMKAVNVDDFLAVQKTADPQSAKSLGRRLRLRPDWESIKFDVMRLVLQLKFTGNRAEGLSLMKTSNALLVEGTYWDDRVWGVDMHTGLGRNWLGVLLMARRAELLSGMAILEFNGAREPHCVALENYVQGKFNDMVMS